MSDMEDGAMDVDQDPGRISLGDKGKGKDTGNSGDDNLPWLGFDALSGRKHYAHGSSYYRVEKYRPQSLDDVVSHDDITTTIQKFIDKNRLPHMLFYGPPGTGKTSTILAVARRIYGKDYKKFILELNASDDRGIDVVREQIKNFAETRTLFSKGFKLIILDEADMMTTAAQAALRRVIEQYTKNVRFCIICNYVNKIVPAIQSRCTRFRFSPLAVKEVEKKIDEVIEKEKVKITPDGKEALLKLSKGDMRRALNILQACHAAYDVTDETAIYNCTGHPHPADIEAVVKSMMSDEFTASHNKINQLKVERGLALQDLISGVYEYIDTIDFPPYTRIYLLDHLATTEHRLSTGGSERLQLTALLGAFKNAIEISMRK
ncbi:hypothetical protein FRB90_008911 [Tulasnella sp. 427]|nr:hypothetical protein FRB90_008911 [Tulasnella sp. 427]